MRENLGEELPCTVELRRVKAGVGAALLDHDGKGPGQWPKTRLKAVGTVKKRGKPVALTQCEVWRAAQFREP